MDDLAANLKRVLMQISDSARKAGRSPDEIELVAISKTHDAQKVHAVYEAGQVSFAEQNLPGFINRMYLLLVAISKTHDAQKVHAVYEAGQVLFGESRVQE